MRALAVARSSPFGINRRGLREAPTPPMSGVFAPAKRMRPRSSRRAAGSSRLITMRAVRVQAMSRSGRHEIGSFVRGRVFPKAASFMELESTEMYNVVNRLREHYRWDPCNDAMKKWVWDVFLKSYSDFKHDCHKTFLQHGADFLPEDFIGRVDCWTWLCGHFVSPPFLTKKVNRTKLTNVHRLGACSIAYLVKGIRAQTESNMNDYSFPTIQAYCKACCREGPEYEPFRLHGEAVWAKVCRRIDEYRIAHPGVQASELVRAIEPEEDAIFEEVIEQTKGGSDLRYLGRAGKGKRSKTSTGSSSMDSCAEGGSQSSGASIRPTEADLLAEALREIKALQAHNAKLTRQVEGIASKVGDVDGDEDEE